MSGAVLLTILTAAHLICVNVAGAGPLVCIWLEWKDARGDRLARSVGRTLAWSAPLLLAGGGIIGLFMGALLWSEEYGAALLRLESKLLYGGLELAFSLALMIAHAVWWWRSPGPGRWIRRLRCLLPLAAGTNLLYHFPLLFGVLSLMIGAPGGPIDSAEFRRLAFSTHVLPQAVHFSLASFAVTGGALIALSLLRGRQGESAADGARAAVWGARLALSATALQIPVGLWLTVQLPAAPRADLLGGDWLTAGLFLAAILSAFAVLHPLAHLSLGSVSRGSEWAAVALLLATVLLMSAVLQSTRGGAKVGGRSAPAPSARAADGNR